MKSLIRLENWIEQLVEEPFVRLFAGQLLSQDVARRLTQALEDGERIGADGTPEIPGRYRIILNPEDLDALQYHHPDLDTQLAYALEALAGKMQVRLMEPPAVLLEARADVPPHAVRITPADRVSLSHDPTRDLDLESMRQRLEEETVEIQAYLIVQGTRTFDLTQPTVRIGRAFDNDLIIEDSRVSRYHAQLRYRYGRYILQDLGSRGGTQVNGFAVQEIVLRPGDVISLAGVDLIYAEGEGERHENRNRHHENDEDTHTYPPLRK
ncbi:MAG TPA: DUF3662 domain-containing protein [Anaerolineae bacterium]|nr:DUF3662 domain-containing protein [Anaerolineae bacterium]HQK14263.1 DUF3662 domain-containing protein [Anaerolineae bacterium]